MPFPDNPFAGQFQGLQSQLRTKAASDPYVRALLENRMHLAQGKDRMDAPHQLVELSQLLNQRNQAMAGLPEPAKDPNPFAPGGARGALSSSSTLSYNPAGGGAGSVQVGGQHGLSQAGARSFANSQAQRVANRGRTQQTALPAPTATGVGLNKFLIN